MLSLPLQVLTVPLVMIYEAILEWAFHKYVLHGLGKNRKSFWAFHWLDHHGQSRRNGFVDKDYGTSLLKWNAQSKELVALLGGAVLQLPLAMWSPLGYATLVFCGIRYYYVHRRSHTDPDWAKQNLVWHYDHHMAPNQNTNWGVTSPWADWLFGTRTPFLNKNPKRWIG